MSEPRTIRSAVVTGPTGAVGTALCKVLAEQNIKAYAVIRPESKRTAQLREIPGVELITCDVSEYDVLPELLGSADVFFHLAWARTTGAGRNDMDTQIKNVQYTLDAVRAAFALGCSVFVGAGSQAEYGRVNHALTPETPCFPENGYGMAKFCAGQMSRVACESLGIDHIWPRILSVYGPHDGENALIPALIKKLLNGERMPLTGGDQLWDYLYADDAARALLLMARHGRSGAIYPLGCGSARPLREYIEALRDEIDHSLPLGLGQIPYGEKQVMHLEADLSALTTDTVFTPSVGFQEGIRKTIDHIRIC